MISKSLSISDKWASLDRLAGRAADFERVLFMLMVTHAEDHGRLPGDEGTIKRLVVPYTRKSEGRISEALRVLHDAELIVWYQVDGHKYVQIQKFNDHQSLHGHDERPSAFPDPPASGRESRPESPTSALTKEKRTEGKGTELKGREGALALRDCYHSVCPMLPKVRDLTPRRIAHAEARLKERPLDEWESIFTAAARSEFLTGKVPPNGNHSKPFMADFDWLTASPDNAVKLLEGKYDNHQGPAPKPKVGSPDYYHSDEWREECKALAHEPSCGTRVQHRQRVALDEARGGK